MVTDFAKIVLLAYLAFTATSITVKLDAIKVSMERQVMGRAP